MTSDARRLLLLRHAKAESTGKGGVQDHDRALSDRGRGDATEMGRAIAGRSEPVELVLCSTSRRTRETWERVQPALLGAPEVRFLRELYTAEDTYLEILGSEGGAAASVLLIGHNPTIHETARALDPDFPRHFPTAALAVFESDADWTGLEQPVARRLAFLTARGGAGE